MSIKRFAEAYLESSQGLDTLVAELRQEIKNRIPQRWEGRTATGYKDHSDQSHETAEQAAESMRTLAQAALKLAGRLTGAYELYMEAQRLALLGGYLINDGCWVYPNPAVPAAELNESLGYDAAKTLKWAENEARGARQEFRWALATAAERWQMAWKSGVVWMGTGPARILPPRPPVAPRPTEPAKPANERAAELSHETYGPAAKNHPEEFERIMEDLRSSGVNVNLRDSIPPGQGAYGPAPSGRRPGSLSVNMDTDISTFGHEYEHFKMDREAGYPGLGHYLENPQSMIEQEMRAYDVEIARAEAGGHSELAAELRKAQQDTVAGIRERYGL